MLFTDVITLRYVAPAMRRVCRWSVGLSLVVVLLTFAFVLVRNALHWPRSGVLRWVPLMGGFIPVVVIMPIARVMLRSIRRDWITSRGRLCTNCAYNVSSLAPTGLCPECGTTYDVTADAQVWAASGLEPITPGTAPGKSEAGEES